MFAGISVVILLQVIVAGGIYLYTKKSGNRKRSEARAAEQDESVSARDLNRSVPAEEENFASVTLKNLNGNLSVDRSMTAEQNKSALEVQA